VVVDFIKSSMSFCGGVAAIEQKPGFFIRQEYPELSVGDLPEDQQT